MLRRTVTLGVALAAALFASCSTERPAAEAALTAAQASFDTIQAEAVKYVPDQVKGVQDSINAARDSVSKGDYAAALASARELPGKIQALSAAVAAKKQEMSKSWADMSANVPQMVQAISSRVDTLTKARKLPANLDKEKLSEAKAGLVTMTDTWKQAMAASSAGDFKGALDKAQAVKAKAVEIMGVLGMQAPAPAQ